jgi:hypothetical protein
VPGFLVTVQVGSIAIGLFVEPFLTEIDTADAGERDPDGDRRRRRGLTGGGQVIGMLERSLIFLFVLLGSEAAVGFLIAAKSIFRFGELRDARNRMEAEYIIIGTLASFTWGILGSWLTGYALGALAP